MEDQYKYAAAEHTHDDRYLKKDKTKVKSNEMDRLISRYAYFTGIFIGLTVLALIFKVDYTIPFTLSCITFLLLQVCLIIEAYKNFKNYE